MAAIFFKMVDEVNHELGWDFSLNYMQTEFHPIRFTNAEIFEFGIFKTPLFYKGGWGWLVSWVETIKDYEINVDQVD